MLFLQRETERLGVGGERVVHCSGEQESYFRKQPRPVCGVDDSDHHLNIIALPRERLATNTRDPTAQRGAARPSRLVGVGRGGGDRTQASILETVRQW